MKKVLFFLSIILALGFTQASATIINVPVDQPTINDAIDISSPGDTVLVAPDTYYENVNFDGKGIYLSSSGGPDITTIDGSGSGYVVELSNGESSDATIEGFTIANGNSGVYCYYSSPTITSNKIHSNSSRGIRSYGGDPTVLDNEIYDNSNAGGMNIGESRGGTCLVQGNLIYNNYLSNGEPGGGFWIHDCTGALIIDNIFDGNIHNGSNHGGGFQMTRCTDTKFEYNLLINNESSFLGGAAFIDVNNNCTFNNNTVVNNTSEYGYQVEGGAVSLGFNDSDCKVFNNVVVNNNGCSGIGKFDSSSDQIGYNDVWNNTPVNWLDITPDGTNISENPLFMGGDPFDYHLLFASPCIDAGHPDPEYNDPDGSRNDMGAYPFEGDTTYCEIYVPDDYPTINEAIDSADLVCVIYVAPGTYYENINFDGKIISLIATGGPDVTTIDGSGSGYVVEISNGESSDASVEGFTITNGNSGVYCNYSSPTITGNKIHSNSSRGIRSYGGDPIVLNNEIYENSNAGGMDIRESRGGTCLVQGNFIHNNYLSNGEAGGGFWIRDCTEAIITENIFDGNIHNGSNHGGGFQMTRCTNTKFEYNLLINNESSFLGGAAFIDVNDGCTFNNNTVVNNTSQHGSEVEGGAVSLGHNDSYCTVFNNIVVNNIGCSGIGKFGPSSEQIGYNDVWNNSPVNWLDITPNFTNISADPLFIGGDPYDYHLTEYSPCINTGNPAPEYYDPDNTRNDMGCYYYHLELDDCVIIGMIPDDPPIIIAPGEFFTFTGTLENTCGFGVTKDIWTMVQLPEGGLYGPVGKMLNVPMGPYAYYSYSNIRQYIPYYALPGEYNYISYVGEYGEYYDDSYSFPFTITSEPPLSNNDEWVMSDWAVGLINEPITSLEIKGSYPNPFNARTTISYAIPKASHVRLEIYNVLGQKVITLINKHQQAGNKTVTWDASNYSSGLYFYKLTTGDEIRTERMTLLK
ncbi:MAG: T9SS type A sorting domain-containing protein [candidate division Zixibacteria bacterium]|nr:T9SS type A sorting domain-containing protein [candidate division Zixibacteria bacterium]